MTQWYYASRQHQRLGPVPADELARLFHAGHLTLDTLVWREGLAQWQRLGDFADELSLLTAAATAPPLPPSPPSVPQPGYAAAPPAAPPPTARPGMSAGKIALIVGAVLILPVVAIIGMLAAISLPAYNDYTLRAKVAETMAHGTRYKAIVAEYRATMDACPHNGDADLGPPESHASRHVAQTRFGELDDGTCGIEMQLRNTGSTHIDDKRVWLSYDADRQEWSCTSEIADRFLPAQCR